MWFKLLLMFYAILLVSGLNGIKNRIVRGNDLSKIRELAQYGVPTIFVAFLILGTLANAPLIILYLQVAKFSTLLAWVSAAQIVIAIINWFEVVFIFPSKITDGTYKSKSLFYVISMWIYDFAYLALIIQHLWK